ncbi:MAG: putative bifunctional diguanylate cyclase/phosphodiesterase [Congregibacter sp.]
MRLLLWVLRRQNEDARSPTFWLHSYTAATICVGASWGALQPLLSDLTDIVVLAAVLMLVFGVLSSAVPILAAYLPAFFGYTLPQVAFFAMTLLREGPTFASLIFALLLYLFMLSMFAVAANRKFAESHLLILENQDLVEQLNLENTRREEIIQQRTTSLENTNMALEREIREREQAEDALRTQQRWLKRMAHHDALTGLPNRLLLSDRLSQSIARAQRNPALQAVVFMDLDHFKQINDSLGHSTGDELLKAVAARLLECVRKEDTVARLGGDEFILLIEQLHDIEDVRRLAEKVLNAFVESFDIDGRSFSVGASMGISLYPNDGTDPESLLRNADAAMYQAKADGRSAYRFYSAEMTVQAHNRVTLGAELNDALEEGQLELYYQPLLSLPDEKLVGAEALIRWNHPVDGLVLPEAFISVAEESVLINRIGLWVLRQGCHQLKAWQDAGFMDLRLSINLSGREIWNNPLLENVDEVLRTTGCAPEMLELEITEGFLVQQPEQARRLMDELRVRGISVTLDDFGTGYSSLSYLKQYPISKLKIDRTFVRDIPTDADDQSIVRAIIAMGHSLDLAIIGEGVETPVQAEFLKKEGCDQVQGFLYAAPMPLADFEVYLQSNGRLTASAGDDAAPARGISTAIDFD